MQLQSLKTQPLLVLLPALLTLTSCNQLPGGQVQNQTAAQQIGAAESQQPFGYQDYEDTLNTYVNDQGLVAYAQLQQNREALDRFNGAIAVVDPDTYQAWSEAEQIAFLINAYNSFTLQSIIEQNPLKASIRDIPGVWKLNRFAIAGEEKTLDNIEHDTLRVDFNEPRIHAALVCAAMSCPPLRTEPFTGEKLDQQLDQQVKAWLSNPTIGLRIDRQQGRVYLSKIFDWFGDDWKPSFAVKDQFAGNDKERAVLNFISGYLDDTDRDYLQQGNYQISYLDYDWALNQQ